MTTIFAEMRGMLRVAAKTKGVSAVARDVGISRGGLYQILSNKGNPRFRTLWKLVRILGFHLTVFPLNDAEGKEVVRGEEGETEGEAD